MPRAPRNYPTVGLTEFSLFIPTGEALPQRGWWRSVLPADNVVRVRNFLHHSLALEQTRKRCPMIAPALQASSGQVSIRARSEAAA
jgi:hypothetical protein